MPTPTPAQPQAGAQRSASDRPVVLRWQAHPMRERPGQGVLAIGIILVIAGFIYVTAAGAGLALLGSVLLICALNRFFFPSRFTIDEYGITAAYPMRRVRLRWSAVQRFVWDEHGGYLSTRPARSRLDAYRGMHLLFDEAQRQRIIHHIQESMNTRRR